MKPVEKVLSAMGITEQYQGKDIMCHCPAHDDSTESLSVGEGKDGKALIKCFANCTTEQVVKAIGLNMVDLMPPTEKQTRSKAKLGPIVATYDYRSLDGTLAHQTTRHEPKEFRQRRPDGNGWVWSLKGIKPLLYRLPELAAAPESTKIVFVEGEKDADRLAALGFVVTTSPMGAGNWKEHYADSLRGRHVVILPDNDDAGRDHAHAVAKSLQGVGAQVKWLELSDLPPKGDVSDWLDAGGTAEQLSALVEAAPAYVAPPASSGEGKRAKRGPKAFTTSATYMEDLAELGYTFALNQLDDVIEVNGQRVDDGLAAMIRTQMRDFGHTNMAAVEDAYMAVAYENRYHPVRRYLDSLVWDGQDHFRRFCSHVKDKHEPIVYMDKAGTVLSVTPVFTVWLYRWMLATVAKAYQKQVQGPVIVLDGDQGLGKSRLAAFLGSGLPDMFLESPIHPDNKDHDRYLATRWIWEIAELGATTRRADREALKAFVTKNDVTFRKPFGRHPITKPALANFIGTINNEAGFLTDPTGNRRFLVVTVEKIDWKYEASIDVHQLWAQIVTDYKQGQRWELLPVEQAVRDGMNKSYEREDPIQDKIIHNFDIDPLQKDWFMFTNDILKRLRNAEAKDGDQALYNGIGTALRRMGLTTGRERVGGQRARGYYGIREKSLVDTLGHPGTPNK
jgi:putative DNA primase/helicase